MMRGRAAKADVEVAIPPSLVAIASPLLGTASISTIKAEVLVKLLKQRAAAGGAYAPWQTGPRITVTWPRDAYGPPAHRQA
jgi:hypothetical protein